MSQTRWRWPSSVRRALWDGVTMRPSTALITCLIAALSLSFTIRVEGAEVSPSTGANAQVSAGVPASPASASGAQTTATGIDNGGGGLIGPDANYTVPARLPRPAGAQLSLKEAIAIALKYHPRAAEAAAQTGAARERVGEARSYLGPQVYGVSEYLRTTDNGIGNTSYYNPDGILPRMTGRNHDQPSTDTSQSSGTSNNYAGGVAVSQYLLDFGRRRGFVAERRFQAAGAHEQEQLVDLDLVLEVSERYFGLLKDAQLVKVFQKAVEQREYHLHEAQVKAKAGLRPELDVYVTQAEVQRAKLDLVDAQNAQADQAVAFDNVLGLGEASPHYQPVDVLTYSEIADTMEALLKTAFELRPDLKELADQARAMGAQIREYRSDYFPTVNAVGGYSAMGTGLPAANNFNAGIVITWPIFNGLLTTHQVAEAELRRTAVRSAIEDLRQQILLQVKTAFLDWQASVQRIRRARQALEASRGELELSEKRYAAGLADIVELEDAQRYYTRDDAAYANALYGFFVAKAAVDHATGRSLL